MLSFKHDLWRYFRFLIGGGLSLLLNLGITYVLTEYFQLWHMLSFTIALCIELIFLFGYHTWITFRKQGHFLRFAAVIIFVSILNWLFVYFLSVILTLPYLLAIIISAGVISILNYFLNKRFVFQPIE